MIDFAEIRTALGARPAQLIQRVVVEATLLVLTGVATAVVCAWWGSRMLRATLLADMRGPVDLHLVAIVITALVTTVVLCSAPPAVHTLRRDAVGRGFGMGSASSWHTQRRGFARALLAGQVAALVILLAGVTLFVEGLHHLNATTTNLGFDAPHLLIGLPTLSDTGVARRWNDLDEVDRIRAIPGVDGASLAAHAPLSSILMGLVETFNGPLAHGDGARFLSRMNAIGPNYFATVGIRLIRGRTITAADITSAARVAVVSEQFARRSWPHGSALGKCVRDDVGHGPCREVIGIVSATRLPLGLDGGTPEYYVPLDPGLGASATRPVLVIRVGGAPETVLPSVQRVIRSTPGTMRGFAVRPWMELMDPLLRPWRLGALLFGAFGAVAFVLVIVGLGGSVSYSIAQREPELAVRLALGAEAGGLARLVIAQNLIVGAVGASLGIGGAVAAKRLFAHMVFGMGPMQASALGAVTLLVLVVTVVASYIPARAAWAIDPGTALKRVV